MRYFIYSQDLFIRCDISINQPLPMLRSLHPHILSSHPKSVIPEDWYRIIRSLRLFKLNVGTQYQQKRFNIFLNFLLGNLFRF